MSGGDGESCGGRKKQRGSNIFRGRFTPFTIPLSSELNEDVITCVAGLTGFRPIRVQELPSLDSLVQLQDFCTAVSDGQ